MEEMEIGTYDITIHPVQREDYWDWEVRDAAGRAVFFSTIQYRLVSRNI